MLCDGKDHLFSNLTVKQSPTKSRKALSLPTWMMRWTEKNTMKSTFFFFFYFFLFASHIFWWLIAVSCLWTISPKGFLKERDLFLMRHWRRKLKIFMRSKHWFHSFSYCAVLFNTFALWYLLTSDPGIVCTLHNCFGLSHCKNYVSLHMEVNCYFKHYFLKTCQIQGGQEL